MSVLWFNIAGGKLTFAHFVEGLPGHRIPRSGDLKSPGTHSRNISLDSSRVSKPLQLVFKRNYAIRDRYYFPLTEQEKMAIKLEEEKAEEARAKEGIRAAKRAVKKEYKYGAARPTITLPGTNSFYAFASFFSFSSSEFDPILTVNCFILGPDVIYPVDEPPIQPAAPKSLNIAVIGPANAGKSTWTNRLCGARVTPVSSKPQTTRERMCGVATIGNTQLVIYDTPGLLSDMDQKSCVFISSEFRLLAFKLVSADYWQVGSLKLTLILCYFNFFLLG